MSGVSRLVASLPTAWFCMGCGMVDCQPYVFTHALSPDTADGVCTTEPVEVSLVVPGVSVRSILELIPAEMKEERSAVGVPEDIHWEPARVEVYPDQEAASDAS